MSLLSDAKTSVAKLFTNMSRLDSILNGPSGSNVDIDNGSVPTLRTLFSYISSLIGPVNSNILYGYGFVGDGSSRPLSSKYSTLAAAQAVYPRATALTNEIDGLAIQKAIDAQASTGYAYIQLPPCIARTTNELDFSAVSGKICGAGPLVSTILDMREGAKVTIRQGSSSAGSNRPIIVEDLYLLNGASNVSGSHGFYIRHSQNTGVLQAVCFRNVIIHKYAMNYLWNVGRGLDFNNIVISGPDFIKQPNGAITIRSDSGNDWGSFSWRFYNCLMSNYRWGWDYQVFDSLIEGQSFFGCAAYNGDGLCNVNCNGFDANGGSGYKALLWSFDNCDWEGLTYALQMKNCRNIKVSGGFYIFQRPYDVANDVIYQPNNVAVAAGTARAMFNFLGCSGFSMQDVEMAAIDLKNSILVDVDSACDSGKFEDSIIRTFGSNPAVAGFRLSGVIRNTIVEKNSLFLAWPGGNKVFYVGTGDQFRQISYTDVKDKGGIVSDDGYYELAGYATVTSGSDGKARINFNNRSNDQSFFIIAPLIIMTTENSNVAVRAASIATRDVNGFTVFAPEGASGVTFAVNYIAYGRV